MELTTKPQVIDALGGTSGLMSLTNLNYTAAYGLRYGPTFPSKYFLVMTGALEREGKTAPASLWGMAEAAE